MATPSHDSDPKPVPNTNVVFIDTNLDTHLALIVSDHDTVSDLKKRILSEHPLCFPKFGQIQIHAIKVKRKGFFYHLSDSMLVQSAFHGFSKSWFLSVDASTLGEHGHNKQVCSAGSPKQVACLTNANNALIGPLDITVNDEKEECPFVNPGVSGHNQNETRKDLETCATSFGNNDTRFPLPGSIPETHGDFNVNHEVPSLQIECEVDESSNGLKDDRNVCEEVSTISLASSKKREKEGLVQDNTSKEKIASDDNLLSFPLKKVSSFKNFEVPPLENKQDEIKGIPFVSSYDSERTTEKLLNNLEMGVKSSGNNGTGIPLPDSILKTQNHHCVNHENLHSHVGCEVDRSSKGVNGDHIEHKDGTSISVSAAKKKRKSKRRREDVMQDDTSKELINESNNNNTTGDIVTEVQQMIKNSNADQSAEPLNDADPLRTSEHGGRRKGKKKSSNSRETLVATSSGKDDEADPSIIEGSVQEEISEAGLFSKGVSLSKTTLENMKIGINACKEGSPSKVKKTGSHKNHFDVDMNVHTSDVNEPKELPEDNANFVLDGAEEAREVLPQICPKPTRGEECTPANQDKTYANIRGLNMTSKVDVNGMVEPLKSEKKRKKRNSKDPDGGPTLREGISPADASESKPIFVKSLKSISCDPASGNTGIEENPLNHTEGKNTPQEEMKGAVFSATVQEDDLRADNASSMEQIKSKADAEQVCKKQRTKPNNKQNSALNSVSDVLTKDDVLDSKKPSPSSDNLMDASRSGKITKKSKSASTKSTKKSSETKLDPVKHSARLEHSDSRFMPVSNGSSHFASNTPKGDFNMEDVAAAAAKGSTHSPGKQEKIIQQEEMKGTVFSATGQEDDFRADNASSMEQIKSKADAEQVCKKQRKKPNKQNSALNSVSDVLTKDDVLDSKKPSPSSDSLIDASHSGKITKKSKSASTKSTKKSSETNLDPVKHSAGLEHSDSRFMPVINGSPHFASNTLKGGCNMEDVAAAAVAKDSTHSPGKLEDSNLEESLKTHMIYADQQILSQQLQHEANVPDVLVNQMDGSDGEDLDLMNGQNARKPEETKRKTHAESLSSSQKLLSKDEHSVLKIRPDKKVPIVHESGRRAKLSSPSNSDISSIREKRKPKVNASEKLLESEKQREGLPVSNSVLQGSKKLVQKNAGKASQNNVGKVVAKTQQQKSLLAGAIFQDDSSGTSENVQEDKSDSSTRIPSDNSLVFDSSDSDSSAGSHGRKGLENGGRSALTVNMSNERGITIDHIFRSSSRYKKAKITASQLEGADSQPEFVPESIDV